MRCVGTYKFHQPESNPEPPPAGRRPDQATHISAGFAARTLPGLTARLTYTERNLFLLGKNALANAHNLFTGQANATDKPL